MAKIRWKLLALYLAFMILCIVILRIHKLDSGPGELLSQQALKRQQLEVMKRTGPLPHHLYPESSSFENFTCYANESQEVLFLHFPDELKEFMRYRHCRNFPVVLRPTPCKDDLYLLFVIKSTASQMDRRAALRDTWARVDSSFGRPVKLVFLLGRSHEELPSINMQPLLDWESSHFGDILQWDFDDVFFNLSLKEIGFLDWFTTSCRSAQFIFKGNDDVFAKSENIITYLDDHKPETPMLTGFMYGQNVPNRERGSNDFIPEELYPNNQYPYFVGDDGYLMSRMTVFNMKKACKNVVRFPLSNVFIGMCLQQLGLNITHHRGFLTYGFSKDEFAHDPCLYRDIMFIHKLQPDELRIMWALVHDKSLTCQQNKTQAVGTTATQAF